MGYYMGMIDFEYIDDPRGSSEMMRHLSDCLRLSLDLESDSYHHYREKLCLIQIATDSEIFVLDPLSVDPAVLAPVIGDPGKEKVFHDVDYDGRMLLTNLGVKPSSVFDTMIAARILGREKVGLADLLGEYFGVTLDKGFQKSDWSRRPLGDEMLSYAVLDVAYLLPLRDRMADEIESVGRTEWAREEFSRLVENLEPIPQRKPSFTRVKGARELSPRQLAVLQKLLEWREERASRQDLPSFKIVGTERLLKMAKRVPRTRRELDDSGILTARQRELFGREIMKALEEGRAVPQSKLPRFPVPDRHRRDFKAEKLLRCLKHTRDRRARELDLDPGFLMSNAVLKSIARLRPEGAGELEGSGLLRNWQLQVMGEDLSRCIQRET